MFFREILTCKASNYIVRTPISSFSFGAAKRNGPVSTAHQSFIPVGLPFVFIKATGCYVPCGSLWSKQHRSLCVPLSSFRLVKKLLGCYLGMYQTRGPNKQGSTLGPFLRVPENKTDTHIGKPRIDEHPPISVNIQVEEVRRGGCRGNCC